MKSLQGRIEEKGREIFAQMKGETPRVFSPRNLTGRLLEWSMRNERLKTQLFRFVDVLPSLQSSKAVVQHASDYLGDGNAELPLSARIGLGIAPKVPWLAAAVARESVARMAETFILARNANETIAKLRRMRQTPIAFTADILGETVVSEAEAEQSLARYLELIARLSESAASWKVVEQIDCDDRGLMPKVNISIKVSALSSQIYPADLEGSLERLSRRVRPLLSNAQTRGAFIHFDMEHTALKPVTIELFKRILDEPELREYPRVGIALQAYLRDSEQDLQNLIRWAKDRCRRITIRLIKGAYWDSETMLAKQRSWPVPVFERKSETDANYERLAAIMLDNEKWVSCAFGTHSVRSIASCLVQAEQRGLSNRHFELQMLYGMAESIKTALVGMGYRVRDYCPIGEILPGMSYLVRRLLENTSNEGFLRATFEEHASMEELLQDPEEVVGALEPGNVIVPERGSGGAAEQGSGGARERGQNETANGSDGVSGKVTTGRDGAGVKTAGQDARLTGRLEAYPTFMNEPHSDFTQADKREAMARALQTVRSEFGRKYPLVIGEKEYSTSNEIISTNPARPLEVIGHAACAGTAEANLAVVEAQKAFRDWSRTTVAKRAQALEQAAELLRQERFRFAALEVFETGKNWLESDADVAEAIDFLNFYAREMRRIACQRYVVPGEVSLHEYIPRGLVAVIAPWNFPLAILCGMTAAAIVAGNCAIVKPSEQSVVIGAWYVDLLRRAGLPAGVVNFVSGPGEKVGAHLVNHPRIDVIAFTGSREVGLKIYRAAGQTHPGQAQLKKAICEMGGKNAAIIDNDADLDEAIPAVVYSAFGYQGQKCSALSRLIVLKENYERVLSRLIEATRSLRMGFPEDPGAVIGPVIDRRAFERILNYIEVGKKEADLAFQGERIEGNGYFIPPTIFTNVSPHARVAQEEIFGPVLCVLRANNLDESIAWANATPYALTGGFYSRSPRNIERVKMEMEVGNLYINRGITGALVARHPFGGFKMSGGGTKAGGREYLQNFLFARTVTENQMRRGFASADSSNS